MFEKYKNQKLNNLDYLVILKNGLFYTSFNNDSIILSTILNYKIVDMNKYIKIGFPIPSLDKVLNKLRDMHINYIIMEDNKLLEKQSYRDNYYCSFESLTNQYNYYNHKLNYCFKQLKNYLLNANIKDVINQIEEIICQINF